MSLTPLDFGQLNASAFSREIADVFALKIAEHLLDLAMMIEKGSLPERGSPVTLRLIAESLVETRARR